MAIGYFVFMFFQFCIFCLCVFCFCPTKNSDLISKTLSFQKKKLFAALFVYVYIEPHARSSAFAVNASISLIWVLICLPFATDMLFLFSPLC